MAIAETSMGETILSTNNRDYNIIATYVRCLSSLNVFAEELMHGIYRAIQWHEIKKNKTWQRISDAHMTSSASGQTRSYQVDDGEY